MSDSATYVNVYCVFSITSFPRIWHIVDVCSRRRKPSGIICLCDTADNFFISVLLLLHCWLGDGKDNSSVEITLQVSSRVSLGEIVVAPKDKSSSNKKDKVNHAPQKSVGVLISLF